MIDLHVMISRLTPELSGSLEAAAALAIRNGHGSIELEHWLAAMVDTPASETMELAGINPGDVRAETSRAIASQRKGDGDTPSVGHSIVDLTREAWVAASLRFGHAQISMPLLMLTMASDTNLRAHVRRVAPALLKMNLSLLEEKAREMPAVEAQGPASEASSVAPPPAGGEDFLSLYANDLTEDARSGKIDRIIGRDAEMRQMVDILMRRRQNNPILLGEAGVGKTAVVEAFAVMIADGKAPGALSDVALFALDMNLLQAGAGVKGEFERRLSGVLDQVKQSAQPIIMFIDEAHSMIGAGGQAGQGDAANILKPALARGDLRTIAATTWSEYKKYFEKDPALTRRFQPVKVGEPDIETAVRMMRAIAPKFEEHHGVAMREGALRAAVELSARYLPERQLPDKAVSVLDTAAAAVTLSRQTDPAALADLEREVELLDAELERLKAEPNTDSNAEAAEDIIARRDKAQAEAATVATALEEQRSLAQAADDIAAEEGDDKLDRLTEAEAKLAEAAGEEPLVHRVVDAEAVAGVIGRWTGVPTGRLMRSQIAAVATLSDRLKQRVLGQNHAIDALSEAMRVARAGLNDARRPQGVFLMVGTSGVGKTETALALADELYGGTSGLSVINMSEFKEEHKVSLLMGSPPGYVGYGEGGVLTEAVRRRPYGVLLLDEMDKAHPGVQDIFYQVFDKGILRDGEGRDVDFRNTTILMTANTGTETLATLAEDPETMPDPSELPELLKAELLTQFKPAFLGRLTLVPYLPLDRETLAGIVGLQINKIADRMDASYGAALNVSDDARALLVEKAATSDAGARAIETMMSQKVLPKLADFFLDSVTRGEMPGAVELGVSDAGDFTVADVGNGGAR